MAINNSKQAVYGRRALTVSQCGVLVSAVFVMLLAHTVTEAGLRSSTAPGKAPAATAPMIPADPATPQAPAPAPNIQHTVPTTPVPAGALTEYKHAIHIPGESLLLISGTTGIVAVVVSNVGSDIWPSQGSQPVNFSYHWLNHQGEVVVFDGERTPLPRDLRSRDSVLLLAKVKAPDQPGQYFLRASMVQEGVTWFDERGSLAAEIPVTVISVR
jgi:hypothetical protein